MKGQGPHFSKLEQNNYAKSDLRIEKSILLFHNEKFLFRVLYKLQ